jgi:exopolysaccharide biosynthesis polyprenyl glycosylphosphotransferase
MGCSPRRGWETAWKMIDSNQRAGSSFVPASIIPAAHAKDRMLSDIALLLGIGGDAVAVATALTLSFVFQFRYWRWQHVGVYPAGISTQDYAGYVVFSVLTILGCLAHQGVYQRKMLLDVSNVAVRVFWGSVVWLLLFSGAIVFFRLGPVISRAFVAESALAIALGTLTWRKIYHRALRSPSVVGHMRQRVLLVGWTPEIGRLALEVWGRETDPYEIVGYVDLEPTSGYLATAAANIPCLGDFSELRAILISEHIDIAVLADVNTDRATLNELVALCEMELVHFKIIPSFFPILVSGLYLELVRGTPLLGVERLPLGRLHNRLLKRTLDIVGGVVGLIISLPIVLTLGTLVYLESPGPIFYRQRRLGRQGLPFEMIKIRSMRLDAEKAGTVGWTTKDDPRRLRIGTFMRKWNLDETPQFWNVLKGEMSLVGPRPERPELIAAFKYDIAHYNARHLIKPGLTGWAQVNGLRGDTDLVERVRLDLYYVEHWNIWFDLRAMFLTFRQNRNAC